MTWWKNTRLFKPDSSDGNGAGDNYAGLPPGDIPPWNEGFEYNFGREVVGPDLNYYRCIVEHDSTGVFANDVAAGYWVMFAGAGMIPAAQDLAQTLIVGNTTGGNDIIVSNNDSILLDDNAGGVGGSFIRWNAGNYIVYDDQVDAKMLIVGDNGVELRSLTNGLTLAADALAFTTGSAALPIVSLQTSTFQGDLSPIALTANRAWNIQDADGTFAFLSDIPANNDLASTLVAGNTTGPTSIVLSQYSSGIESPAGDALYMGSGDIELVSDYNGNYNCGLYASSNSQYAALFFGGWGGAYEGANNLNQADPRGGYALTYTPRDMTTGGLSVWLSDNAVKTAIVSGLIMSDVTNDAMNVDLFVAATNKKAGFLLADGCTIETGTIFSVIQNSISSTIGLTSAYANIISSNISRTQAVTYGAIIASEDSDLGLLGSNVFRSTIIGSNLSTISGNVTDSGIFASQSCSISPATGLTFINAIIAGDACSINNKLASVAIIASAGLTLSNALIASNSAIIASNSTAWGEIESSTLYADAMQVLNYLVIRDGASHVTTVGQVQLYLGVAGGGRAVFAEMDNGNTIQLFRGAAVPNASGIGIVDIAARSAVNALAARMRVTGGNGLIAD